MYSETDGELIGDNIDIQVIEEQKRKKPRKEKGTFLLLQVFPVLHHHGSKSPTIAKRNIVLNHPVI